MFPYMGALCRVARKPEKLFHLEYYLSRNPDVSTGRIHPLLHFLVFGAFEGRQPNPFFDPAFYRHEYADVARAEVNPLLHYLKHGAGEGRKPHPLCNGSLAEFLRVLDKPAEAVLYSWWMEQERHIIPPSLTTGPRFSLLLAISGTERKWLQEAIAAVHAQSYPHWELCICFNCPGGEIVESDIARMTKDDSRVRAIYTTGHVTPSLALQQAASLATGDYLTIIGQADRLSGSALSWLAASAPADLIYSDEDRLDESGARHDPLFKPDWSPDLLLSHMYLGRLMTISRTLWERSGGIRGDYEPAFEYDLALRAAEKARDVRHVPRILYSRRVEKASNNNSTGEMQRCLADALARRGLAGTVEAAPRPGSRSIRWEMKAAGLASVIICSRSPRLLEHCLESLSHKTLYRRREIIVIQHLAETTHAADLSDVISRYQARAISYEGDFHFSRMNNRGAEGARGETLVFLNDDTEILEASWLERLMAQTQRPEVGVAGARLLYPSGTLQHGGVAIGVGVGCGHIGRGSSRAAPHWPWTEVTRDVSAVTGACLAIRTSVFRELGGFDDGFPVNYNDIDLCLRAGKAGYRVIYDAAVVLAHHECQSRQGIVTQEEYSRWCDRWCDVTKAGDPFYNPNLTRTSEDLSLRSPIEAEDA